MTETGGTSALSGAELIQIPVGDLVVPDHIAVFSFLRDNDALTESVRRNGIIQPLLATGRSIICGVKRLSAAKAAGLESVPALSIRKGLSKREQFELALNENRSVRSFNIAEQAGIVNVLSETFGLSHRQISSSYAENIGISGGTTVIENLLSLHNADGRYKEYCVEWNIPLQTASRFFKFDKADRDTVFEIVEKFGIHGGKLKQFLTLTYEISRMERISAADLLESAAHVSPEKATRSQKIKKLFEQLQERRLPLLSKLTKEFESKSGSLQELSPGTIIPPACFEGDSLTVRSSFKTLEDLDVLSKALQDSRNRELIRQLLQLL